METYIEKGFQFETEVIIKLLQTKFFSSETLVYKGFGRLSVERERDK